MQTHSLLIIGKDVMILPSTKMFNVAHILSVIRRNTLNSFPEIFGMLLTCYWPQLKCYIWATEPEMLLTTYVHRKRRHFTTFYKTCNPTHNLWNKTCVKTVLYESRQHHLPPFRMASASWIERNNATDFLFPCLIWWNHIPQKKHIHPVGFAIACE